MSSVAKHPSYVENVYVMKRVAFSIIIFGVLPIIAFAETDVNMRASKKDGVIRLVFEAEESFIKKTNVTSSGTQINIEFPSAFNAIKQKGFDLETSTKERILTVSLKESFEMKVLKLSSPPRLVIDITTSKQSVDVRPLQDVVISHKTFVLDPGHGGYDFGITVNDLKEKNIVLSIVKDIEASLFKKDKKVFITRRGDQFMSIKDRAVFANQKMPEVFVSIHVSTSGNFVLYVPMVIETGIEQSAVELYGIGSRQKKYIPKSKMLADAIVVAIKEEFNLNIIQREMPLPILDSVGAPAVLIELPSFKIMNYDQKTRSKIVEAILKGFSQYGQ
jgi:N-acetylmuramoyl-L-alanine amidase